MKIIFYFPYSAPVFLGHIIGRRKYWCQWTEKHSISHSIVRKMSGGNTVPREFIVLLFNT